jgi:hypothetical protein
MMLELDDAAVSLLLRDGVLAESMSDRWSSCQAEQDSRTPYGVVECTDQYPQHHMNGRSGLVYGLLEVSVYSGDKKQAQDLASQARRVLYKAPGVVESGGRSLTIQSVLRKDGHVVAEVPVGGKRAGIWKAWALYTVAYEEETE